jgi:septum formation protein
MPPHPITPPPLILASTSNIRQKILRDAGLDFSVQAPNVDEPVLQEKMLQSAVAPEAMATALAQAKALSVTHTNPDALVIGADQVLHIQGQVMNKATDQHQARENLAVLQGKTHELVTAVCVSQKNRVIWAHSAKARLSMRTLTATEMDAYCARAGDALLHNAGGYALENLGSWLFEDVDGDFFTILGLPLLPLQHFLRAKGYGL